MNKTTFAAIIFMIIGALSRFITAIPNVHALEAIALMGGAYIAARGIAYIIPIATLFVTDMVLNNTIYRSYYDQEGLVFWSDYMIWNIVAMLLITTLGIVLLKKVTAIRVIGGSLIAALLFFLITNFGAWINNPAYPQNFGGLMLSYEAGLPFLRNSLLGTMAFSSLLFGSFELYQRYIASKLVTEKA